jgi:hypothetical protein
MDKRNRDELSRIVLSKLLMSECAAYMSPDIMAMLQKRVVSTVPSAEFVCKLGAILPSREGARIEVAYLQFLWVDVNHEVVDDEGNLWVPKQLKLNLTVHGTYKESMVDSLERIKCLDAICDVAADLESVAPEPVYELRYNNAERIARDSVEKYKKTIETVSSLVRKYDDGKLLKRLVVNGRPRVFDRLILSGIEPGTYHFAVPYGSYSRPKYHRYEVTIAGENVRYATVRKIK